jgi:uncharacterized protein involved in exopolysaccharide biosynthesis
MRFSVSMSAATQPPDEAAQLPVFQLVLSHRVLVIAIVLVFTIAAAAVAFLSKPIYRANAVVLPAESGSSMESALGGLGNLGTLVGLGTSDSHKTVEAIALLRSRDFAENFIRDHDLVHRIFADRWDSAHSMWRPGRWPSAEPSVYDAYQIFDRKIRHVSEDKKTGIVTLSVDWTDAAEGARWANEMIERANEVLRQRALREADASIELLTNELRTASNIELRDSIARTIDTYVKSRALTNVRPDYAFKVIDPGKPAGPKDFIRPQRSLYLISGPVVGLLFALFVVVSGQFLARQRTVTRA